MRTPIITLFTIMMASCATAIAAEIYVAPTGSDTNPGTKDKPFATLERARDAARQAKGSTVVLSPGTYRLTKTFALDERDSGTTYRGENARITGSIAIPNTAVKPVTDSSILARLLPEVRGKVLEIDLRSLGIADFGEIGPRGFRRPYVPAPIELIVGDEPLRIAQWPNPGQPGEPMGRVHDKGSVTRNGEKPARGGIFEFATDRPARWAKADDVWITGLFANGFADNTVKVKAFDLQKKTIATVHSHMYGFTSGKPWNRWTALNLLEEIDLPGEFMADKKNGKLYFLPPAGVAAFVSNAESADKSTARRFTEAPLQHRIEVTVMKEPLIAIEGATNVVFDGVSIENSRGMGVYIERGANNRIQNCTLRNLGMVAICVGKGISADPEYRHGFTGTLVSRELGSWHEHIYNNPALNRDAGSNHGIVNCKIYNIGAGAISLSGGDRKTLTPAGNFVENCEIFHFNRWDKTYKGAVNVDGVGNRIAHCKIYDGPAAALYLHGNDHVIEYNEIFDILMKSADDMGAFYMGRDPTERGNIIRYNYWHDIGKDPHSRWALAIYFDDRGGDDSLVYGNIFRNCGKRDVFAINGGSNIAITNNIFIDCPNPVSGALIPIAAHRAQFLLCLNAVDYDTPLWRTRYPNFANYLADYDRNLMPRGNVFRNNLLINTPAPKPNRALRIALDNNPVIKDDLKAQLFVDPAHGNFALKPGARIAIPGFEPIPFEKIGLKKTQ